MIKSKELDNLDFKLAQALGLKPIQYVSPEVGKHHYGTFVGQKMKGLILHPGRLFNPTRNWEILGKLLGEHGVFPEADYCDGKVSGATVHYNGKMFSEAYMDEIFYDPDAKQQDNETAIRVAIVRGLIEKLAC